MPASRTTVILAPGDLAGVATYLAWKCSVITLEEVLAVHAGGVGLHLHCCVHSLHPPFLRLRLRLRLGLLLLLVAQVGRRAFEERADVLLLAGAVMPVETTPGT